MTTRLDDGPEFEPDDPLAVILRPASDRLAPPPGRYEAIRRTATRRRVLRTAAGVGVSCAVAALVALPLHLATRESPAPPSVPLAPPASGRTASPAPPATPTPSSSPERVTPRPTQRPQSNTPGTTATPSGRADPTRAPVLPTTPLDEPSKRRTSTAAEPEPRS
ncbi:MULTISPECIES: hypothetical protein [Streptomyces]|uniref:Uncharacterized protein n=1 Tax=Streptomyces lonegramiae TaxID=3075524 RepID=A0ABU2XUF7_9ACTN|nr:hypothetical protein [Streptomyces sp. DSM 41529]MDT0549221.1 hypothetical protein [Streptomyces sp. DSM 41529]